MCCGMQVEYGFELTQDEAKDQQVCWQQAEQCGSSQSQIVQERFDNDAIGVASCMTDSAGWCVQG